MLEKKEIILKISSDAISLNYYSHQFRISAQSYAQILRGTAFVEWQKKFGRFDGDSQKWQDLKMSFLKEIREDSSLRSALEEKLEEINSSVEKMHELLRLQFFLPTYWKLTEEKINYRRFFTINGLICLRMEDREVFQKYHRFILELCRQNLITGLRIDHIDGLFDPQVYLRELRKQLGNRFYIIIEKILEWDEKLPAHWPVQGTSGYGFLAAVNQVLTQEKNETVFAAAYDKINPRHSDYASLVYEQKQFILKERMGGEYDNLWELAYELDLVEPDVRDEAHKAAMGAFLAAFPVYRIYPEDYPLKKRQRKIIQNACEKAQKYAPSLKKELDYFRKLFHGEAEKDRTDMLYFLQRCQQFTGPLAAKGVEDTTFYIYNKLLSHNEVGDSPANFGITAEGFHQRMKKRREGFPLSINATATHDTKRGEDARMRINVLSELAEEWFGLVEEWTRISSFHRRTSTIPDSNEAYFIFQMLIGHWPFEPEARGEAFYKRSKAYLQKVLREAKEHSSWAEPDEQYEETIHEFLKMLLYNEDFLKKFLPFQKKIAAFGAIKSLAQCLLKITTPGIPDIYQGTELWDLSYVDPDNRRQVNYEQRKEYLKELRNISKNGILEALSKLKENYPDGKIKMYCLHKALELRNKNRLIFEEGNYFPLEPEGKYSEDILAFARVWNNIYTIIIVPLTTTKFFTEKLGILEVVENDTVLSLPLKFPGKWKNCFTKKKFKQQYSFTAAELFQDFPVAVLKQN